MDMDILGLALDGRGVPHDPLLPRVKVQKYVLAYIS